MSAFVAEDFETLEPGVYPAIFDRAEESDTEGRFGFWIDWFFNVQAEDGVVSLMGRSSKPDRFTRSTKARQWYEAILGRELAKGETADLAKLKGIPVTLTVDVVKTEKGDERNRIVSIRRQKAAPKPVSKPEPVEELPPVEEAPADYDVEAVA